ncbi:MAG: hypothetical protein MUE86_06775, partial [Thiobacillaceae bacterium]|nr:hypothetical protein [Thiobacillaceae bacterium]
MLNTLIYVALSGVLLATAPARAQWPAVTDTPTHVYAHGRAATVDLFTDDVAAAERFYSEVFGWTFERHGQGQRIYSLARADGQRVGGVAFMEQARAADSAGRWIIMISVPDVEAANERVVKTGGKTLIA